MSLVVNIQRVEERRRYSVDSGSSGDIHKWSGMQVIG